MTKTFLSRVTKNEPSDRGTEYRVARVLAFALPVVVMLTIFALKGIYPFGDRSFLSVDLYHQYMPFFSEFARSVRSGDGISYTWNVGMGSNFLALYVYYLASPLHWPAFLVPQAHIMEYITYLVVVKIGLCGLSSFFYLSGRYRGRRGAEALLFSCAYALSGFMAAYNWNIMWLDCVILLPLIVLGLERLVREGSCVLYCVTLALSIFTNYYISIMICIFLVQYFVFLYCTELHAAGGRAWRGGVVAGEQRRLSGAAAHLRPIAQFAACSLLAAGMAGMLLVPEICAILKTDFCDVTFPGKMEIYFSVPAMLARHFVSVPVETHLAHWPNIYCGAGIFLLAPLYFANGRIPAGRRVGMLFLAGFMLLGFSVNVLDFLWHGMNFPDSLPARQSFLYIFLMLVIGSDALANMDFSERRERRRVVFSYLGAAAVLFSLGRAASFGEEAEALSVWLTFGFVTFYAALLWLAYQGGAARQGDGDLARKKAARPAYQGGEGSARRLLACLALAAVVAETGVNMYNTSVRNVSRDRYLDGPAEERELYEWASAREDGFFRVEKFTRTTKNDGALAGYPTASVFSSTMNSDVAHLYKRLGMRYSKVFYCFDGATAFTSALLNVRYLYGENDAYESSLYRQVARSGETRLYEAAAWLPFGYVAPVGYDLPDKPERSGLLVQNQMARDLGVRGNLFVKYSREASESDAVFVARKKGIYYAMLTDSGTARARVTGGSPEEQSYANLKNGSVLFLGELEAGQRVVIANDDEEDESPRVAADFYCMDEAVLQEALDILRERHLADVRWGGNYLRGSLELTEPGRLILSVPFEEGWRVTLNGKDVEPERFGRTLMAFDLEAGAYTLEMRYVPKGQGAGLALSILSIFILRRVYRT